MTTFYLYIFSNSQYDQCSHSYLVRWSPLIGSSVLRILFFYFVLFFIQNVSFIFTLVKFAAFSSSIRVCLGLCYILELMFNVGVRIICIFIRDVLIDRLELMFVIRIFFNGFFFICLFVISFIIMIFSIVLKLCRSFIFQLIISKNLLLFDYFPKFYSFFFKYPISIPLCL